LPGCHAGRIVEPAARIVTDIARSEGGAPLATVVGTPLRTGAVWAALANGTAATRSTRRHELRHDGHPTAPVLSAALAAGELALATAAPWSTLSCSASKSRPRWPRCSIRRTTRRDFTPQARSAPWAPRRAAARLLGLDANADSHRARHRGQPGLGAQGKLRHDDQAVPRRARGAERRAFRVARPRGFTASEQALEGPQGYFAVLGAGKREERALETLGAPWKILKTGVAVKPYPSCACTHSIIDSALELRRTHAITPEQVEHVTVGVGRVRSADPHPLESTERARGQFSGEFSAAAALCDGRVGIATFRDDKTDDPAIKALMKRVRVVVDRRSRARATSTCGRA